jgi:hypothetical protein
MIENGRLLVLPDPLSAIVVERRMTSPAMSPMIRNAPMVQRPSPQATPPPAVLIRRSTRSHQFIRKDFVCKEDDSLPIIGDDDDNDDAAYADSGNRSKGLDTTRVKRSVMVPERKPKHDNAREKDVNGSQSFAAAASFIGTGDGTVNLLKAMVGVRDLDNDNSRSQETAATAIAVASRKKKFKPTTKSAPTQSECNNQDAPFVVSPPPTLLERHSTLRLSHYASMTLTFTPSLMGCHQKGRFSSKRPHDVAMTE